MVDFVGEAVRHILRPVGVALSDDGTGTAARTSRGDDDPPVDEVAGRRWVERRRPGAMPGGGSSEWCIRAPAHHPSLVRVCCQCPDEALLRLQRCRDAGQGNHFQPCGSLGQHEQSAWCGGDL